jgi:hypothetical protein
LIFQFIQSLTSARSSSKVNYGGKNQVELFVDDDTLVFARGDNAEVQTQHVG